MKSKIRILYVEDDPEWQEIIQDATSILGYDLDFASSSKEAMYKLKRKTYHVALLDKRLNANDATNEQGMELAHVIAGINEGTNIIVYTQHGEKEDVREAFRTIKVWDFVDKDKPINEITEVIRDAAQDADIEFQKPIRMPLEILTTKGDAIEHFVSYISPESLQFRQSLETLGKLTLGKYRPLLADQNEATLLKIDKKLVLQVRFWSKLLGVPIAAWFGKYDDIKQVSVKIEEDADIRDGFGIRHQVDEITKNDSTPALGGIVFELLNVELDEFKSQLKFGSN